MVFACQRCIVATTALIFLCSLPSKTIATTAPITFIVNPSTPNFAATCEFRTINYITNTLPQQCLRSSWSGTDSQPATRVSITDTGTRGAQEGESATLVSITNTVVPIESGAADKASVTRELRESSTTSAPHKSSSATTNPSVDVEEGELNDASFLSFEDWKKQTLEKAGQHNLDIGKKRTMEAARRREAESFQSNLEALGDDGEIDLDFGAFSSGENSAQTSQTTENKEDDASQESKEEGAPRGRDQYRSKDAGKTCKERFSYASFDAGATILKTHPGAKNSKAVLIENKDSYMLTECKTENKFLIIELSEDIWIDTLVLANYEFFSSMLRTFRVSVSDRYPVKIDKWKDLGVYEARNSREIQAFLIENPQIWARYIRIEFLTHYGKEYYCPLSLVRVHGTRMLESWKETEANNEEDDNEEVDEFVPEAVAEAILTTPTPTEEKQTDVTAQETPESAETNAHRDVQMKIISDERPNFSQSISTWKPFRFEQSEILVANVLSMCLPSDSPDHLMSQAVGKESDSKSTTQAPPAHETISTIFTDNGITSSSVAYSRPSAQHAPSDGQTSLVQTTTQQAQDSATSKDNAETTNSVTPVINKSQNMTSTNKTKSTNTSSGSNSLPTIQESFFKAVSRRLQLLESNSTLSLKYIEEQSKMLREAFSKVEKKQLQKTTDFLQSLNNTVLTELRGFRQQYDEIWQSTVISLESQREESQREILAISSRLSILADEVVFQKRMSIVQSILLLLCLGLVIFSRVSPAGPLDFSLHNGRSRIFRSSGAPMESPLDTPGYTSRGEREDYIGNGNGWARTTSHEHQHRRQPSDESLDSRSRSRGWGPPTPVSVYSRSDTELTPPRTSGDEQSMNTNTNGGSTGAFTGSGTFSRLRKTITLKNHNQSQSSTPSPLSSRERDASTLKEKENHPQSQPTSQPKAHEPHRCNTFGPSLPPAIRSTSSTSSLLSVTDAKERRGRGAGSSGLASLPISDMEGQGEPMDSIDDITSPMEEMERGMEMERETEMELESPVEMDDVRTPTQARAQSQTQIGMQILPNGEDTRYHEQPGKPLPALPTQDESL